MAMIPKTLTYEEWLDMPVVQDAIEEVVNGRVYIMPPNIITHARVVRKLNRAIEAQVDENTAGVFASVFGLVIRREPLTCRVPDVALFEKASMREQDGYVHSAPQLIIEVLSPSESRRDIQSKLRDYESIGVPEVWLVSPEAGTVEVLRVENASLRTHSIQKEGKLSPVHFPSVAVEISSLWPE